jgi:hypothetical protein
MRTGTVKRLLAFFWLAVTMESAAHAYLGPGVGLAAVGAVLGLIGSVFLALAAFVWYPVKRVWKSFARRNSEQLDSNLPNE